MTLQAPKEEVITDTPTSSETATPEETTSYLLLANPAPMDIETAIAVGRAKPQQTATGRPDTTHTKTKHNELQESA
jgi:hypothetical protein